MKARGRNLVAMFSGILFGAGLAVSQMINPDKIINFLDVSGSWDPSLGLVMLAALLVTSVGFRFLAGNERPLLDGRFHLPSRSEIDVSLLAGAAIFGIGWGLAGYCPGPGLAAITLGTIEPLIFTIAVLAGFQLHRMVFDS